MSEYCNRCGVSWAGTTHICPPIRATNSTAAAFTPAAAPDLCKCGHDYDQHVYGNACHACDRECPQFRRPMAAREAAPDDKCNHHWFVAQDDPNYWLCGRCGADKELPAPARVAAQADVTLTDDECATLRREVYRELYPGPVNTHDSKRTRESDLREADRAYELWDRGRAGFAPTSIVGKVVERLAPAIESILAARLAGRGHRE